MKIRTKVLWFALAALMIALPALPQRTINEAQLTGLEHSFTVPQLFSTIRFDQSTNLSYLDFISFDGAAETMRFGGLAPTGSIDSLAAIIGIGGGNEKRYQFLTTGFFDISSEITSLGGFGINIAGGLKLENNKITHDPTTPALMTFDLDDSIIFKDTLGTSNTRPILEVQWDLGAGALPSPRGLLSLSYITNNIETPVFNVTTGGISSPSLYVAETSAPTPGTNEGTFFATSIDANFSPFTFNTDVAILSTGDEHGILSLYSDGIHRFTAGSSIFTTGHVRIKDTGSNPYVEMEGASAVPRRLTYDDSADEFVFNTTLDVEDVIALDLSRTDGGSPVRNHDKTINWFGPPGGTDFGTLTFAGPDLVANYLFTGGSDSINMAVGGGRVRLDAAAGVDLELQGDDVIVLAEVGLLTLKGDTAVLESTGAGGMIIQATGGAGSMTMTASGAFSVSTTTGSVTLSAATFINLDDPTRVRDFSFSIGDNFTAGDPTITFDGVTNDGTIVWDDSLDQFNTTGSLWRFGDSDVQIDTDKFLYLEGTATAKGDTRIGFDSTAGPGPGLVTIEVQGQASVVIGPSAFGIIGSFATTMQTVVFADSPFTIVGGQAVYTMLCDANLGNVLINLPQASTVSGVIYNIKRIDANQPNSCTVDAFGAETIDAQLTAILANRFDSITIQTNGTAWFIL